MADVTDPPEARDLSATWAFSKAPPDIMDLMGEGYLITTEGGEVITTEGDQQILAG